jgi:hypothetical protein
LEAEPAIASTTFRLNEDTTRPRQRNSDFVSNGNRRGFVACENDELAGIMEHFSTAARRARPRGRELAFCVHTNDIKPA